MIKDYKNDKVISKGGLICYFYNLYIEEQSQKDLYKRFKKRKEQFNNEWF